VVDAPVGVVWRSLTRQIAQQNITGSPALVRLLGARPQRASGTPLEEGATVPGFAVAEAVPEEHVRLAGRHHFSRYVLEFAMSAGPEGTVLAARSYGEFPGITGFVYRKLVIGSGAHPVLVRRMLRSVRRHAEAGASRSAGD
jgi:hypothetical protein